MEPIKKEIKQENLYDVVVIGGGPAGLTAALYLARARYRVVVLEKENFGGQITITSEVVNFPGVFSTSGSELTETMRRQAQNFGAEFLLTEAEKLELDGDIKSVYTNRGRLDCFGILVATGAHPRSVGFEGEAEFKGRGVAYCATCDGEFFTGKEVFVIGGGFAAAEESMFLTKYARHVTILVREDDFTCAKSIADTVRTYDKITVKTNMQVESVSGDEQGLHLIRYRNLKTGELIEYHSDEGDNFGVFVFAGYEPATSLVKDILSLNEQGYIITDKQQKTAIEGLYAAGDICVKNLRQVVTAVGDGAIAATELEKYVATLQKKLGVVPKRIDIPHQSQTHTSLSSKEENADNEGNLFTEEMKVQLNTVFSRMAQPLVLQLFLDERAVSQELEHYMATLASMTDKLSIEKAEMPEQEANRPCVKILLKDGTDTGLAFHGVPGGHEFTSFILGLYNAAGPGQSLEPELEQEIEKITSPMHMQLLISLSCTMCPELVSAAQQIAAHNSNVTAEVYDINHFPKFKEDYKVMSVPCLIIHKENAEQVIFGKKNIKQLVTLLLSTNH